MRTLEFPSWQLYVGQKLQIGASQAWACIHPALGGIGVAGTMATFFVALYYNVIVAWAIWFLGNSFGNPLAWDDSGNSTTGAIDFWEVATLGCRGNRSTCSWTNVTGWAEVEARGPNLWQTGGLVGPLVGCLAFGWFLIWLCVSKGIESLGKVAWFTAIFPYFVLAILLVRGLTLPGASAGLHFYLSPRFDRLGDPKVWIAAASQIFYSTGVGWGTLIAFASYNKTDHNYMRDAWLVPLINCGTSFLAGLVVFSVLGFMATEQGVRVEELRLQGSGLAFVAYPSALSQMYGANLFAFLFFIMVICLGVDSQFAMVETVLTALNDARFLPTWSKAQRAALVCSGMALVGLLFVTRAGLHWLDLFDTFSVTITLFLCGALECIGVCWVYGADRFAADTLRMTKVRVPRLLLFDLTYIIPSLLCILTIWSLYSTVVAGYPFPPTGLFLGWVLSLVSCVPIVYALCKHGAPAVRLALASCVAIVRSSVGGQAAGHNGRRPPPPPRLPPEVACATAHAVAGAGSPDASSRAVVAAAGEASPASPASRPPSSPLTVVTQKAPSVAGLRPDSEVDEVAVV